METKTALWKLVESLKRGLERIDKHAEADLVQDAYVNEAEFKYKVDNMWSTLEEKPKHNPRET